MKIAYITGITGQDGSYLAELLLTKNYEVHGLVRRSSNNKNILRINSILNRIHLHTGDLTDISSIKSHLTHIWKPETYECLEIYNLGAQSHVHQSFSMPEYTAQVDAFAPLAILEWMRSQKENHKIKFYQASTSELFGKVIESPQNENTTFNPCSPYSTAKLFAYWSVRNYRDTYKLFAVNGILFNHESPRRGDDFVTRKITLGIADIVKGNQEYLTIGNLEAKRDWGHARNYVEGMWKMLQCDVADDFVLGTGTQHSVREFLQEAWSVAINGSSLVWKGTGVDEKGYDTNGVLRVTINKEFFRPSEVHTLLADIRKAERVLEWKATTPFKELVREMMISDLK